MVVTLPCTVYLSGGPGERMVRTWQGGINKKKPGKTNPRIKRTLEIFSRETENRHFSTQKEAKGSYSNPSIVRGFWR